MVKGPVVRLGLTADHANENGLLLIFKPQVRSLLGHRRYAGQAIGGQCYRPIVPLRLSREIEPKPLAIFILGRSEEHTSELQSLLRISYAVFCLKQKKQISR